MKGYVVVSYHLGNKHYDANGKVVYLKREDAERSIRSRPPSSILYDIEEWEVV